MRAAAVLLILLPLVTATPLDAQDALAEARRLYNSGQYAAAEQAAHAALLRPHEENVARVVLGRIQLERYRQSAAPADLAEARRSLRAVDPATLNAQERIELALGFAEVLFLEDRFAAAAEMFEPIIETSERLGLPAHTRVLDWWATALDRHAQTRSLPDRAAMYERLSRRMREELARDGGSAPAAYWIVAAARGAGDLELAWNAAMAAWIRASFAPDRGAALRGDLDRLIVQAVIPERAGRLAPKDPEPVIAGLLAEWESFKAAWAR